MQSRTSYKSNIIYRTIGQPISSILNKELFYTLYRKNPRRLCKKEENVYTQTICNKNQQQWTPKNPPRYFGKCYINVTIFRISITLLIVPVKHCTNILIHWIQKKNCPKDFHKFISKQFRDVASGERHFLSQQRSFVKSTYKDVNYDGGYPRLFWEYVKKKRKN